jgi:hypothetical protein
MSISSINSSNSGSLSNASSAQAQAIKTMLAAMESQPTLLDILAQDSTGSANSSGDILDLSAEGQSAADQLSQLLDSSELQSMQTSADEASVSIQQKLRAALARDGIDTSKEIDLQVDSNGNVVVANDNPQKQQIENTINNDADLKKAVTQYLQFMQALAPAIAGDNSQTGVNSQLDQLLSALAGGDGTQGTVTLAIQGSDFQTSFQDANGNSIVLASSAS